MRWLADECAQSIKALSSYVSPSIYLLHADLQSGHRQPRVVYKKPLHLLGRGDSAVDISSSATPERYRLVDCKVLVEEKVLQICEYRTFPEAMYCSISYVWRNVKNSSSFVEQNRGMDFDVKGAEGADPINTDVLHHACMASLRRGCTHLWLDRLCIMQTCKQDKQWQIREMYHMYQACSLCVVLAGGLQCMMSLECETSWIHRGWTLQEALAPSIVEVLFAWKLRSGAAKAGTDNSGRIEEVVPNQSAVISLSLLLKTCATGVMSFTPDGQSNTSMLVEAKLFSSYPLQHSYNDIPLWRSTRKILSPNVVALCVAMDEDMDEDTKLYAIWQSALMRTSSRPVDMVLSIMGLFGVSLDPKSFKEHDRLGATIALARAILVKGGRATWLGASFKLPPCKQLSTFAMFPRTRMAGKALVKVSQGVREVSELMDSEYHYSGPLIPFPQGSMDDNGYFTFVAKAVRVQPATTALATYEVNHLFMPTTLKAKDGSVWQVCCSTDSPESTQTPAFVVLLGWYNSYYPGQTPSHDADNIRAMLIVQHAPGKSHVRSYIFLSIKCRQWVMSWEEHQFCVGPETTREQPDADDGEELVEASVSKLQLLHSAPNFQMSPHPTLMDLAARQARWAIPQNMLEQHGCQ
ncbi:hypothetical protein M422DRAFT_52096 [Sphaerobolus stellatus SS14]|uniref:Heterokaryon incompatibility domain-containing protein n=1 Tax=Sphaerobolus stellatus (strain SS14) TaxID=990650 RepID=A0A0C9V9R5_SPHS4|nr:hypothetical protein M422DRAFT_52096 [Sphaerobolus stellatus SS14]